MLFVTVCAVCDNFIKIASSVISLQCDKFAVHQHLNIGFKSRTHHKLDNKIVQMYMNTTYPVHTFTIMGQSAAAPLPEYNLPIPWGPLAREKLYSRPRGSKEAT